MSKIVFEDYTGEVTEKIRQTMISWLYEAGNELASQTITRTGTGKYYREIASKWDCIVDEEKLTATIGNPLENALWVEYGTGEYALNKDGRKPYWVYVEDNTGKSNKSSKIYTLEEAKRVVAIMRSKGLKARYTSGTPAKRPLHLAFTQNEEKLKDHLKSQLGGMS